MVHRSNIDNLTGQAQYWGVPVPRLEEEPERFLWVMFGAFNSGVFLAQQFWFAMLIMLCCYFSWPVISVSSFLSPTLAQPIHLQGEHATLLSQRIVASAAACLCQIIPLEEFGMHFLPQSKTTKNTKHQLATDSSQNSLWKIANNESMWSVALHYGRLSSAGVAIQIIGMHWSWRAE